MWNDGGKGIIDIAEAHRDMFFMVYTNGLLIDEDKLKRLMDTANLNPAISVEGFEDLTDKRRGKGAYKKIMSRFEMMRKYGFPFGLSVTTTKNNIDLLMNDPFYEYWFDTVGIMYMWMFQYMPIGRAKDVTELMLSPAERVSLLKEWEHLLFDKSYFVADFWNSGSASDGCVAYGRRGGYFHVNWKGNISPCVFVPYWKDNINELYSSGKTIMDAIFSDYFKRGREWQKGQGCFTPGARNHFAPCSMRDNYHDFRTKILTDDVHPDDKNAEEALLDPAYYQRLNEFDKELWKLTYPMWQERAKVKD
jgi:MoaA/NifB/PqqE/SkfB family radical SAM enzyme